MRETYLVNVVSCGPELRNKFHDMLAGVELGLTGLGDWAYFKIKWAVSSTIAFDTNAPQLVSKLRKEFSNFGVDIVKE